MANRRRGERRRRVRVVRVPIPQREPVELAAAANRDRAARMGDDRHRAGRKAFDDHPRDATGIGVDGAQPARVSEEQPRADA